MKKTARKRWRLSRVPWRLVAIAETILMGREAVLRGYGNERRIGDCDDRPVRMFVVGEKLPPPAPPQPKPVSLFIGVVRARKSTVTLPVLSAIHVLRQWRSELPQGPFPARKEPWSDWENGPMFTGPYALAAVDREIRRISFRGESL